MASKPERIWVSFLKKIVEHSLSKIGMIAAVLSHERERIIERRPRVVDSE